MGGVKRVSVCPDVFEESTRVFAAPGPAPLLYAVGRVSPHSGTEPTPGQERTLLILNVCTLAYVLIAPAVVLWVAWRTRHVVVGWLTAAAIVIGVSTVGAILIAAL